MEDDKNVLNWDLSDVDLYQEAAHEFAAYPHTPMGRLYPFLALAEEAGEVCGKLAKAIRKGVPVDNDALADELGDVFWNLAECANMIGRKLSTIARGNIEKLSDRRDRGKIIGEGDDR